MTYIRKLILIDYIKKEMLKANISDVNIEFYYSENGLIKNFLPTYFPIHKL